MDNLSKLQILNLFKKYDYLISEFEIKNEISNLSHAIFKENVNKILTKSDSLLTQEIIEEKNEDSTQKTDEEPTTNVTIDEDLKVLYRKIVKLTHPDKIKNHYLNDIYIKSTEAIEKNDRVNIFRICLLLGIEFELNFDILSHVEEEINKLEKKINFVESSYHMRWHYSDKEQKINIMLDYLKKQIKLCEA